MCGGVGWLGSYFIVRKIIMGIENTEKLLAKFGYDFTRTEDELVIKMDFSQRMIVDFSDPDKMQIKDKLVGWNFLTGLMKIRLKYAILYNYTVLVVMGGAFLFFQLGYNLLDCFFLFLVGILGSFLWMMFYLIKSENLRQLLIRWNDSE